MKVTTTLGTFEGSRDELDRLYCTLGKASAWEKELRFRAKQASETDGCIAFDEKK